MNNGIKADLVLQNGFVYTVDKQRRCAEAVAVTDKVITYVGDTEGVQDFIGPNTEVLDLAGKMLLPGFIDSHIKRREAFGRKNTRNIRKRVEGFQV